MKDSNNSSYEQSSMISSSPSRSTITSRDIDTLLKRSLSFRRSKNDKKKNKNINPEGIKNTPKALNSTTNSELVRRRGGVKKQQPQTKSIRLKNSEINEFKNSNSLSMLNFKSGFDQDSNNFNSPGGRLRCSQRVVNSIKYGNKKVKKEALLDYTSFGFSQFNLDRMYKGWKGDKIISYIFKNIDAFHSLLKEEPRPNVLQLLINILVKTINTTFREGKKEVYSYLCDKGFVEHLILYISSIISENISGKQENMTMFFSNFNLLLEDIINLLPYETLVTLHNLLIIEIAVLDQLQNKWSGFNDVLKVAVKMKGDLEITRDRWIELGNDLQGLKNCKMSTSSNDLYKISLYPTSKDLRGNNFCRENIVEGSYDDVPHYLDIQFRLLREDFIDPLRDGICHYKRSLISTDQAQKRNFNVRIYKNVRFLKTDLNQHPHNKLTIKIHQKLSGDINWGYPKLLPFGSLVLFSTDNFETFQLATVADKDVEELSLHGTLNVSLVGENIFGDELFTSEFVMAESSALFDPVYQVLKTIKEIKINSFPMERYLLVHDISPSLPRYLIDKPLINIKNIDGQSFTVNINDNLSWPPCQSLNLNPSQVATFKFIMKNEFSVVQGPPGTGKKYLGFKIVQTILENFDFDSPILLVSYTNHALDKFLEGLLTVTNDIIRIGDQSKNVLLDEFNYRNVRKTRAKYHPARPKLRKIMTECLSDLNSSNKLLERILNPAGIINIVKYKYIKLHGIRTFENSNDFLSWLLGDAYNFINYIMKEYVCVQGSGTSSQPKPLFNCKNKNSPFIGNKYTIDDEIEGGKRKKNFFNPYNNVERKDLHDDVKGQNYYILTLEKLEDLKSNIKNHLFQLNSDKSSLDAKMQVVINDLRLLESFIFELNRRLINRNPKPSTKLNNLLKVNIRGLRADDKWALYHIWIQQVQDYSNNDISNKNAIYTELLKVWNEIKVMEDFTTLDNLKPKIIGLTTTGAARHHTLISLLKPPIIIVEEAAEVLEAHIVTALTRSCQHLILIGDYNQLKPHLSSNLLAEKYHLDVSLFERMINNGINCQALTIQHRMKPNIASLITSIYPELTNHSSVGQYPSVLGISKNLFFINHNFFELNVDYIDKQCHENPHEAEFMIMLCRHLLLQGYNPSDITILTPYSAQQFRLLKLRKQWSLLEEVKISLVDSYTGEENNIILLSLVRSNNQDNIGFLSIKNRISVALSRAKFGLYIIGNMDLFIANSSTWHDINVTLKSQGAIGKSLSLVCQIHKETVIEVKCANDFKKVPAGGCNRICSRLMGCGHTCISHCHVLNLDHKNLQCELPCNRMICQEPNHSCPLPCYQTCLPCEVMIKRILPKCKHEVVLPCNTKTEDYQCLVKVEKTLPCGHTRITPCFQDSRYFNILCLKDCHKVLPCGHLCLKKCHEPCESCREGDEMLPCGHATMIPCFRDPSNKIQCLRDCGKLLPCGHKCRKKCHQPCGCVEEVEKTLPCDHTLVVPCFQDPGSVLCPRNCEKVLPCGHICQNKCYELCGNCTEEVEKRLPCGHTLSVPCFQDPNSILCFKNCEKILPCGHRCQRNCQDLCGGCRVKVEKILPCTHILRIPCFQDIGSVLCPRVCGKVLPCGHICQRKCHDPCGGCTEECNEISTLESMSRNSCCQCTIL